MNEYMRSEHTPDYVSPPGETLEELLAEKGMSQIELAKRTGRRTKTINQIIKGIAPITPETAIQFERALGVPASFWNNRESRYQEYRARIKEYGILNAQKEWLKKIPLKEMIRLKWVEKYEDEAFQAEELLKFYGITHFECYTDTLETVYCRRACSFAVDKEALVAWMRKGEIEGQKIFTYPYDEKKFKEILREIRAFTVASPEAFIKEIPQRCSKAGVAVVFVPELSKTHIYGATRWLTPQKALISLSLRYKTDDHFWFTFFHEAGHIIHHGKRDMFIEEKNISEWSGNKEEEEANRFAANFLIPHAELSRFINAGRKSADAIVRFADRIGIAPGIIVGRLQHEGYIPMSHCNAMKRRISWNPVKDQCH